MCKYADVQILDDIYIKHIVNQNKEAGLIARLLCFLSSAHLHIRISAHLTILLFPKTDICNPLADQKFP